MTFLRCPRRFFALVVALALVAASCGVTRGDDSPAATITHTDGTSTVIDKGEVDDLAEGIRSSERFVELVQIPPEDIEALALTQIIQTEVIAHALNSAGGSVSTEDVEEGRDQLQAEIESILGQNGDPAPAESAEEIAEEISVYLDVLATRVKAIEALPVVLAVSGATGPENPCVSHILVETEEEADEVVAALDDGADFAELAVERSIDPGSGSLGGDLGCASVDQWVPEFRDAVLAAEVGVVTAPVRSDFGFHVILVTGTQVDDTGLVDEALLTAFADLEIEVDPAIGTWDPASNQVIPPPA